MRTARAADKSIAVRADADTNGDSTGAEVGQDDPRALGQVRADRDQPHGGTQDVERVGNRLRSPRHRHGGLPCLREPGDAPGDGEQIRRNPRAREPLTPQEGAGHRAAAASGCAADQGRFVEYAHALFVNQPPEGGPGLSDAELADIGRAAGLADAAFPACVADAPYLDWPPYVTVRAAAMGVQATPTVLVEGTVVRPETQSIAAAIAKAGGGR